MCCRCLSVCWCVFVLVCVCECVIVFVSDVFLWSVAVDMRFSVVFCYTCLDTYNRVYLCQINKYTHAQIRIHRLKYTHIHTNTYTHLEHTY